MARLAKFAVDDSRGDEFPDVKDLVKKSAVTRPKTRMTRPRRGVVEAEEEEEPSIDTPKSDVGRPKQLAKPLGVPSAKGLNLEDKPKPKPRKRILNQTSANPLLRPLLTASSRGSSASTESLTGTPRRRAKFTVSEEKECLKPKESRRPKARAIVEEAVAITTEAIYAEADEQVRGKEVVRVEEAMKRIKRESFVGLIPGFDAGLDPEAELGLDDDEASLGSMRLPTTKEIWKPMVKIPTEKPRFTMENEEPIRDAAAKIVRTQDARKSSEKIPPKKRLESLSDEGEESPSEEILTGAKGSRKARSTTPQATRVTSDTDDDDECSPAPVEPKSKTKSKRAGPGPKLLARTVADSDIDEEDASVVEDDSDDLSDFVVNDSTILDGEDADSVIRPQPPRSVRRIVKGRRVVVDDDSDEELGTEIGKLRVDDDDDDEDDDVPSYSGEISADQALKDFIDGDLEDDVFARSRKPKSFGDTQAKPTKASKGRPTTNKFDSYAMGSEDPFSIRLSPPQLEQKSQPEETRFVTPPPSPSKPKTLSPIKKILPRIPATPHRQSSDNFWQQDVINDWNDEYSPVKASPVKIPLSTSPIKSPVKALKEAKAAKKSFNERKAALAEAFLKELDEKVTNGKIGELAASTGGVKIIWSKKLNTTAGRANWKRETFRAKQPLHCNPHASQPAPSPIFKHHAAIELAEKVIDDEDRLLNVIAHEFCHLANFMVSNIKTNPHGKEFQAWGAKCGRMFSDRGIVVTTKHSYQIDYKYIWECTNKMCGVEFKRHSKSIDPARHQCGSCKSRLVQTKPIPRGGAANGGGGRGMGGDGAEKKINDYQVFVKENMKAVREANPGSPQKDIMRLVGKKYQEYKASKFVGGQEIGAGGSKEQTPNDGVEDIARKLVFLDLTSP